jgi:hypothetical protein
MDLTWMRTRLLVLVCSTWIGMFGFDVDVHEKLKLKVQVRLVATQIVSSSLMLGIQVWDCTIS